MGKKQEEVGFVTDDKWVLQGGVLDETDEAILKEAGKNGPVVKMSTKQMLDTMEKTEPKKFRMFRRLFEKQAGIRLTKEKLIEFAQMADARNKTYVQAFSMLMTIGEARQVRAWRVDQRRSWRSVARTAFERCDEWHWPKWDPPSNQLAGMALCEVAAKKLGGSYRKEPWN